RECSSEDSPESEAERAALRGGRLGTRTRDVPAERQEEQAERHAGGEQRPVARAPARAVSRVAITQSVAGADPQGAIVAEPGGRISAAVAKARIGKVDDLSLAAQPLAE